MADNGNYEPIPRTRREVLGGEIGAIEAEYTPNAFQQFATGAARSLAGPVLPLIQAQDSEWLNQRRRDAAERHAIADTAGSVAGYLTGAFGGVGLPGILVGAGRAAGARTAAALGGGALGSAAGALVAPTVESAGIALSEATGEGVIDRAAGVPGASIELGEAIGSAAKVGALAGTLSIVLPKTADIIFRKVFDKRIRAVGRAVDDRMASNKLYNDLKKELDLIESEMSPEQLKRAREFAVATGSKNRYNQIIGEPGQPQAVQHLVGDRLPITGMASGEPPAILKAWRGIKSADDKIHNTLNKSLQEAGSVARENVIDGAVDAATMAIGGPHAWMFRKIFLPSIKAMQTMLYQGIMHTPGVRWAMSNALKAGKASGAFKKMGITAEGTMGPIYTSIDKYVDVGRAFTKALKIPALRVLSNDEVSDISDEIVTADLSKYEKALRYTMAAKGVPQEVASASVADTMRTMMYVQSIMPPVHPSAWIVRESKPIVPESKRAAFSHGLRAALVPPSVLADFLAGTLTREAAQAWWATNPDWADMFAQHIRNTVDIATSLGKKYTPKEKYQIGLMVNQDGSKLGRSRDPIVVQLLQGQRAAEEAQTPPPQVGGPKPAGDPGAASGMSGNVTSPSQGLTQRITRR